MALLVGGLCFVVLVVGFWIMRRKHKKLANEQGVWQQRNNCIAGGAGAAINTFGPTMPAHHPNHNVDDDDPMMMRADDGDFEEHLVIPGFDDHLDPTTATPTSASRELIHVSTLT